MELDFRDAELQFLLNQLARGRVVLFAGAGFSVGATNRLGQSPPLGIELAELLCTECGWKYAGDELPIIYEQAQKHLGTTTLRVFLERHFRDCAPADWQRLIPQCCWHRIYTTNVDDTIENSYAALYGQQRLDTLVCPAPFEAPDVFMERVACIHLHGYIRDTSKAFTFSLGDFGRVTAFPNPWYQGLIEDMQARTILYVGSKLTEAPFYHYIALRTQRSAGVSDNRAKAFLISQEISPVRRRQLLDQNIIPLAVTGQTFFMELKEFLKGQFPKRVDILRVLYPHQLAAIEGKDRTTPSALLRQFDFIVPDSLPDLGQKSRSFFYLGAEPTWADIRHNVDAERQIHREFLADLLNADRGLRIYLLAGYAGSGKTSVMMRVACETARSGKTVYYFKGEAFLDQAPLESLSEAMGDQTAYIFIDNAHYHFRALADLLPRLPPSTNLVFVLADRSYNIYPHLRRFTSFATQVRDMPELSREDTLSILDKLKECGFLGELQGKPISVQVHAFLVRAHKQLLVALREATSGKGFDAILADEYERLEHDQARLAYVITSLATMHGAPGVRRRHLLASLDGTDLEKARIVTECLRDVVVPRDLRGDLLAPRHRIIGRFVAVEIAPIEVKLEAIRRFLAQVSADITPVTISRRVPEYIAYRGMINFDGMKDLFGRDYTVITGIYDDLKAYYGHDFLFWLQYGRVELEFDNFDLAENYLNQSLGIRPESHQTLHHLGVLYLKRSYTIPGYARSLEDAQRGEEILERQIQARGMEDPYPYSALLVHKLRFIQRVGVADVKEQMEKLYNLAKVARERHPYDDATQDAIRMVERAYLMQAVR